MQLASVETNFNARKFDEVYFSSRKYTVKLAETSLEKEQALYLRYQIFNLELGAGDFDITAEEVDTDEYDKYCDHLIVLDNQAEKVIGTYRLQDSFSAESGIGFYTSQEFSIHLFESEVLLNSIELGRACIQKEHRSGRVLYMLWKGIAKYIQYYNKRYLFGCCSIHSEDVKEGWELYHYLNKHGYVDLKRLIPVEADYICPREVRLSQKKINLPNLFQLYLDLGAKVCSAPALDHDFGTIDFLILLDLNTVSKETKQLFF